MSIVDFSKIQVLDIEGKSNDVDIRRPLGNLMYMQGQSIEECELGQKVYHSEGAIEVTDEEKKIVNKFSANFPYITRQAIEKQLNN